MAKQRYSREDIQRIDEVVSKLKDQAYIETEILDIEGKIDNQLSNIFKKKEAILNAVEDQISFEKIINLLKEKGNEFSQDQQDLLLDHARALKTNIDKHKKIESSLKTQKEFISDIGRGLKDIATASFRYLMDADRAIKQTALSLGLSSERSDTLRTNFEQTAGYAAQLGARMNDLATIQREYANITGRATLLNKENLSAIIEMGKGTSMGIEAASRMAGQFEILGYNAGQTRDLVQNIVDTSERFGVNTAKVLENITENFQRAQRFRFKDGVESLARMAQDAAKFKIDMNSVIDSAEKARTLEGALEMAARLQVMGGGFSQMGDAFTLLFESRNDLEAYQKTLNSMLGDIAIFNKRTGEFEISALNLDRLRHVAEATGESFDDLVNRSRRLAEIQKMQPFLAGLAPEDRELVENMAQMTSKGGFTLQVGNEVRSLRNITPDFVNMLRQERKTLEERAKAAQTFDEVYANTIEELKTLLLPLLREINWVLGKARGFIDNIREFAKPLTDLMQDNTLLRAGILISGAVAGLGALKFLRTLPGIIGSLIKMPKLGGGAGGGFLGMPSAQGIGAYSKGLLSFGAAILAIGGGVKLAADGIANLANSFEKLPLEKIEAVKNISYALIGGFAGMTIAMAALAPLIAKAGVAMLPFGAAIALIGGGIGIAAAGIGYMVQHLSELGEKNIGQNLMTTSAGIMSVAGASMMMANPATLLGLATLTGALYAINKVGSSSGMNNLAETFGSVAAILNGDMQNLKELKETIKEIKGLKSVSSDNPLADLKEMFSKPLKVEFSEKEVNLVVNVDSYMDGDRVAANRNFRKSISTRFSQTYKGYS